MRKLVFILGASGFMFSCGSAKSGKQIGEEVCDCFTKANDRPTSDTTRTSEQNKCMTKQQDAWAKVKDDEKKSKEFNETIGACSKEQIKKSFGQ